MGQQRTGHSAIRGIRVAQSGIERMTAELPRFARFMPQPELAAAR